MMLPILITLMVIGAQALATRVSPSYPGYHHRPEFLPQESPSHSGHHGRPGQVSTSYVGYHDHDHGVGDHDHYGHHGHHDHYFQVSPSHVGRPVQGHSGPHNDAPTEGPCTKAGPSNPFADALLKKVAELLQPLIREKGFDPVALQNESYSFTIHLGGFTLEVELAVYDGWFTGLSNFTLCGDFVKDKEVINGIKATAKFPELKGNYTGKVTVLNYESTANITLKVEGTSADVIVIYNTTSCKFEATDVSFNVGKIAFEISGLGPLDPILDELFDYLTHLVVPYIQKWASKEVKPLINKFLENINLDSIKKEITDTGNLLLDCQAYL